MVSCFLLSCFLLKYKSHRHFFKWNYMISFTYYNFSSHFEYKSIIKRSSCSSNLRDILYYLVTYFNIKFKIFGKILIFILFYNYLILSLILLGSNHSKGEIFYIYKNNQTISTKCQYQAAASNSKWWVLEKWRFVIRIKENNKNKVPIITWSPWNTVATKKVKP